MRRAFVALALLVAGSLPAVAQDKAYEIKLKKDAKGDRLSVQSGEKTSIKVLIELMGMANKNDETSSKKEDYVEEILEYSASAKKATKLTRAYAAAEETKSGVTKKEVYAGKTVLIEKKGDKFKFSVGGEELAEDDAEDLDKEFNKKDEFPLENDDFLPGKPVKLNDTWTINAEKIVKSFESDAPFVMDAKATKVSGKLVKAYAKGGHQFGVLELTLVLGIKAMKLDGNEIPMKAGSAITGTVTLDLCIDATTHAGSEKTTLKFDLAGEIPNGTIKLTGDVTSTKAQEELKK